MDFYAYLGFFITVVFFDLSISITFCTLAHFHFECWCSDPRPQIYRSVFIISMSIICLSALPFIFL